MSCGVISTHILVESPEGETDEQFCAAIDSMILQTYSRRPDWLEFSTGTRFVFGGRHFREFVCYAGSVSLMLMQRAKRDGGFTRAIVCRADYDGVPHVFEIRAGTESQHFGAGELHVAS